MSEFAKNYSLAVHYDRESWERFRRRFESEPHHLWGGPDADNNLRAVAADAYQDATGDDGGAGLLRTPGQHVVFDGDRVRKGRFTAEHLRREWENLHRGIEDWANHDNPLGLGVGPVEQRPDGLVSLTTWPSHLLSRDEHGHGAYEDALGDPMEGDAEEVLHPADAGRRLAGRVSHLLNRDLGWNRRWQNSVWDEFSWQHQRQRVRDSLERLRLAPTEEVVPGEGGK